MNEILPTIIIGIILGLAIAYLYRLLVGSSSNTVDPTVANTVELKIREVLPEILRDANQQLVHLADQQLSSEKREIRADLEGKRSEIERLIKVVQQDLKESKINLELSERDRIGSFNSLKSSLDEYKQITAQLAVTTESLKKVLSNNQLRGQFGERVCEDLLRMCGFVKGLDYVFNQVQENSSGRPDFSVFMPDGTKVNVDVKFPFANLQKYIESDGGEGAAGYLKLFEKDVREKIKQVCSRDYINPDDKTVDFVILFIPNEMIFSFVYEHMDGLWSEAMEKKVILAGPFSFTAVLRLVRQAYQSFKYQENIRDVIDNVKAFEKEFGKFYEEYQKVGEKIQALEGQYNSVNSTRANQLLRRVEKVKLADVNSSDSATDEVSLLND